MSRAHRDRVMEKVMSDPRLAGMRNDAMPFDADVLRWGSNPSFPCKRAVELGHCQAVVMVMLAHGIDCRV